MDEVTVVFTGAQAHAVQAALSMYLQHGVRGRRLGGDAFEVASIMDVPAVAAQSVLTEAMWPEEPAEPLWDALTESESRYAWGDR